MTTGLAGVVGHAPTITITQRTHEQAKYETMWSRQEYRQVAPGEESAAQFLSVACPPSGSRVIDFGAGTGRGAVMLSLLGGVRVHMVDFAGNCLDDFVREALVTQPHALTFAVHDLTVPLNDAAQFGYCTDVMEHIPPEEVDLVLRTILRAAQHVYLQISCTDDSCGKLIGEPLHLSVHPYEWWLAKLRDDFECVVHWSEDRGHSCAFYVTAWWTGKKLAEAGVLNVAEEQVRENVRTNAARSVQQCRPFGSNDIECMILGGGPSAAAELMTIRAMRAAGAKLVTLNGAYNWALEQGLDPSAQVVCDARAHNVRFVQPTHPLTLYLLASQCHPSLYEAVPAERTWQWHTTAECVADILNEKIEQWFGVPGGSTVLLRTIPLLRMLGYRKFHLFGCDSCLGENDAHHGYAQSENDGQIVLPVELGGRIFRCHPWMASQASEFVDLIRVLGDLFEIEVHGGGLLAWALQHASDEDMRRELQGACQLP